MRVGLVIVLACVGAVCELPAQGTDARIPPLIDRLEVDEDRATRALLQYAGLAVPYLLEELAPFEPNAELDPRSAACLRVLGRFGADATEAVPRLLTALERGPGLEARVALLAALGRVAPFADDREAVLSHLIERTLQDDHPFDDRYEFLVAALTAVARIGVDPNADDGALDEILRVDDNPARVAFAAELAAARPASRGRLVPALLSAIRREHDGDLRYAWSNPGDTGSTSVGVDGEAIVRPVVAGAVYRLVPSGSYEPLIHIEMLQSGKPDQRIKAAIRLGHLEAANAVAALVSALDDGHLALVREAITALGMIGARAHAAVPALEKLAEHEDRGVNMRAHAALRSIRRG